MALSKERTDILTQFFFTKLWPKYPDKLCGGTRKKGPRGEALKSWLKIGADEAEMERIYRNLDAQVRFDEKATDPARWPYMTTYLNQRRYDDLIDARTYDDDVEHLGLTKECRVEGCKRNTLGPRFTLCDEHYALEHDRYKQMRKDKMVELKLMPNTGEPKIDYYRRIKEWAKGNPGVKTMLPSV